MHLNLLISKLNLIFSLIALITIYSSLEALSYFLIGIGHSNRSGVFIYNVSFLNAPYMYSTQECDSLPSFHNSVITLQKKVLYLKLSIKLIQDNLFFMFFCIHIWSIGTNVKSHLRHFWSPVPNYTFIHVTLRLTLFPSHGSCRWAGCDVHCQTLQHFYIHLERYTKKFHRLCVDRIFGNET